MGCAFFGTPFRGSEMAKVALLYSSVFGNDAYESLLSFMRTEKNDTLDEVVNDFMEISGKLLPPIELCCAYEQVPTDEAYAKRAMDSPKISRLMQHKYFKAGAKRFMEAGFSLLPGTVSELHTYTGMPTADAGLSTSSRKNPRCYPELTPWG